MAPMTADWMSVKPSPIFASKPHHNKGEVMASGNSWVSISINASAIIAQVKTKAAQAANPKPKCHAMQALRTAVNSSTAG